MLAERAARRGLSQRTISIQAKAMIRHFLPVMHLVSVNDFLLAAQDVPIADPDVVPLWATAIAANAQYVSSHNTRHFPPLAREQRVIDGQPHLVQRHVHAGIECLTAIEFIEDVLGADAAVVLQRSLPMLGVERSRRAISPV